MGYEGAKLAPLFNPLPAKAAAVELAEVGRHALASKIRDKTPVDTGELKASWLETPILVVLSDEGEIVYETRVATEVGYAPDVEYGTGLWGPKHAKYLIEPKNPDGVLHWIGKDGQDVFARRVWHPGSPGAHMVAISVAETEAELHVLALPVLEAWKKEQEAQGLRGQR